MGSKRQDMVELRRCIVQAPMLQVAVLIQQALLLGVSYATLREGYVQERCKRFGGVAAGTSDV